MGLPTREILQDLERRGWTLATAESCTGGLIAGAITAIPGSSRVFQCGFVTYANRFKEEILGVPSETLVRFGAVSAETASAMALGACEKASADVGLSVTGIAGPGGGTPDKPVGLVYIGCAVRGKVFVERQIFEGSRKSVRIQTVRQALEQCHKILRGTP